MLRSESPSGKCAKLHTVAANNNRDYPTRSLSYCLFVPNIYGCYSSRTSRSRWIAHSTQRQRIGCNKRTCECPFSLLQYGVTRVNDLNRPESRFLVTRLELRWETILRWPESRFLSSDATRVTMTCSRLASELFLQNLQSSDWQNQFVRTQRRAFIASVINIISAKFLLLLGILSVLW